MEFQQSDSEQITATIARHLAALGAAREVAAIADSEHKFFESNYDNWNGGQQSFELTLVLPAGLYEQIREHKKTVEANILSVAKEVFSRFDHEHIDSVNIHVQLNSDPLWRGKAKAWLSGKGVNNQGRVRSDNVAPVEKEGLLFRSQAEVLLYSALKSHGVPIAPLPVFVTGGKTYSRIEPDLLVIKDGIALVVEVDGDTFHHESPVEAQNRLAMLTDEGIEIHRVNAGDCETREKAESVAQSIIAHVARLKSLRIR